MRAGIIGEVGRQDPWTPPERHVLQGAFIAQQETGAARRTVHPGRPRAIRTLLGRGQVGVAYDVRHRAPMARWDGWGYVPVHRTAAPLVSRRGFVGSGVAVIAVDAPRRTRVSV